MANIILYVVLMTLSIGTSTCNNSSNADKTPKDVGVFNPSNPDSGGSVNSMDSDVKGDQHAPVLDSSVLDSSAKADTNSTEKPFGTDAKEPIEVQDAGPSDTGSAKYDAGTDSTVDSGTSQSSNKTCIDVSGTDYGDCKMKLGWGFDGNACRAYSGCSCEPNCQGFFNDMEQCAKSCASEGYCNTNVMTRNLSLDQMCDTVFICVDPSAVNSVDGLFNGIQCPAEELQNCQEGTTCASTYGRYYITQANWDQLCVLSMMPVVNELTCWVWL